MCKKRREYHSKYGEGGGLKEEEDFLSRTVDLFLSFFVTLQSRPLTQWKMNLIRMEIHLKI
jgi:hypothetical protein